MNEDKKSPQKLTDVERLELEASFLKIKNLELQGKLLQQDMVRAATMLQEEQKVLQALVGNINTKYEISVGRDTIQPDGTILRGS